MITAKLSRTSFSNVTDVNLSLHVILDNAGVWESYKPCFDSASKILDIGEALRNVMPYKHWSWARHNGDWLQDREYEVSNVAYVYWTEWGWLCNFKAGETPFDTPLLRHWCSLNHDWLFVDKKECPLLGSWYHCEGECWLQLENWCRCLFWFKDLDRWSVNRCVAVDDEAKEGMSIWAGFRFLFLHG